MLYQLSYTRELKDEETGLIAPFWREEDLNPRRHTPAGLQPAPFGHLGIPPVLFRFAKSYSGAAVKKSSRPDSPEGDSNP